MNKQIVIVEDENIIALDIKKRLKSYGYDITAIVPSGEEAIRAAEELRPDLIIMDIVLKGEMDGFEAAEWIIARTHIPIVYLTAYSDNKTLNRMKNTTPLECLVKPFNELELRRIIDGAFKVKKTSSYN